ncbi:MAG: hypothetical protein ACW972_03665 [Promethearchaeota archaeon]|jgi:hypothetical protein
MGFKKVDYDELKTKISPNFLGIPLREGGKLVEKTHREKKIESSYTGSFSEVLILNEEFLELDYDNNGKRKSALGNGNISIFNNSMKDRIWDSNLQFSGSQFDNQQDENSINLGIFEPSSNKVLKYEIVNSEELPDLVKVSENIENQFDDEYNSSEEKSNNYLLRLGKENNVKFTILIENISNSFLDKIVFRKVLPENFYDLEFKSSTSKDFKVSRNSIECSLNRLNNGEKTEIVINAKIFPKKKENIKTGKFEITFNLLEKVISGVRINQFSGYSHAMHAIKKTEKNHAPNNWQCSLIFENHSDFKMKLKSILIYDKSKSTKILEKDFSENVILPRGKYKSVYFDVIDEKEPTFTRKVEYSIVYKTESNSMMISKYDDNTFKVAGVLIKKKLSEGEINSFEQSELDSKIVINNEGTIPIKGLLVSERIPADFLPPRDITEYKIYRSSGVIEFEDIEIKLSPDDDDPSHEHTLELSINLKENRTDSVIEVEDFLEIKYPLKAITPDNKKEYNFPLKVYSYYPKSEVEENNEFFIVVDELSDMDKSAIKINHKRRKLMVGKEIFPGRSSNEFAIYVVARNGSNTKLSEVNITDTFPDSFELISANLEHKVSKSKKNGEQTISFTIDTILPFQEREIMYYLKNIGSNDITQSELESYFVG